MFKVIKQLFFLLSTQQRKEFYILQILVIFMSILEILGIASIIPFMGLVGDMSKLEGDSFIANFYQLSGVASEPQFVFFIGISVLIILFISTIISIYTTWKLSMYGNKIGTELADRLYTHYLGQGWLFHASGSSALLTKKIVTETSRVTIGILVPLMMIISKIILAVLLSISIFLYDPKVAIIGLCIFGISYFLLYEGAKRLLYRFGSDVSKVNEQRYRLMNEGFGGIKDVLLLGRDGDFIKRFNKAGDTLAYSNGSINAIVTSPRYFVELLAFGSMIVLILYLIGSQDVSLGMILPILSVYAVASIKLLPAFQTIYSYTASIKANIPAFESIHEDLLNSYYRKLSPIKFEQNYIHPQQQISLENVSFTYPRKEEQALKHLNITIPVNNVIGIVGPSGSGKSTLIDILLGLIEPQQGQLMVDNTVINDQNRRSWQNSIGFVAQSIFLSEGTIAENVAFGIPHDQIDLEQVQNVLKLANVLELVNSLDDGIHTKVGERGVQLSGGQRQRIGIARALYHKAEVLVLMKQLVHLMALLKK